MNHLLDNRISFVIGYSGLDDYDLFQYFMSPTGQRSPEILWLQHINEPEPDSWEILHGPDIDTQINEIEKNRNELETAGRYYEHANPLGIANIRRGYLVKAVLRP